MKDTTHFQPLTKHSNCTLCRHLISFFCCYHIYMEYTHVVSNCKLKVSREIRLNCKVSNLTCMYFTNTKFTQKKKLNFWSDCFWKGCTDWENKPSLNIIFLHMLFRNWMQIWKLSFACTNIFCWTLNHCIRFISNSQIFYTRFDIFYSFVNHLILNIVIQLIVLF